MIDSEINCSCGKHIKIKASGVVDLYKRLAAIGWRDSAIYDEPRFALCPECAKKELDKMGKDPNFVFNMYKNREFNESLKR